MRTYRREVGPLAYASPGVVLLVLGGVALLLAGVLALGFRGLAPAADGPLVGAIVRMVGQAAAVVACVGIGAVAAVALICLVVWLMKGRKSGSDGTTEE